MGYQPFVSNVFQVKDSGATMLGSLLMTSSNKQLTEVIVKGQRPVVEQKIDMTVLNVQGNILAEASNSLEVLQLAPGIYVDETENKIVMSGKDNVDVMINGKLSKLTGRDLVKFLKAIRSTSVQSVEVITNPSSKYDVQGNRGILNIRMRKDDVEGFNGNVNAELVRGARVRGDFSNNLNYEHNNLKIYSYLAYHFGKFETGYDRIRNLGGASEQKSLSESNNALDKWSDPVVRVGADYSIGKWSTISALAEFEKSTNRKVYQTNNLIKYDNGTPDSTILTNSYAPNTSRWNTYNLNYHYADDKKREFSFDIDDAFYGYDVNNRVINGDNTKNEETSYFNTRSRINILTFKADFSTEFSNKLKLESGLKLAMVTNRNNFDVNYLLNSEIVIDSARENNFKYTENVSAAYINLGRQFGKVGIQVGGRMERSDVKGNTRDIAGKSTIAPDSTYYNFLPSIFVSYAPKDNHAFRLSFTQRIKRPDYESLQPVFYQQSPFSYYLGNPSLKPQRNANTELAYTLNKKANFTLGYNVTKDYVNPYIYQIGDIYYQTTSNTGTMKSLTLSISYPIAIAKWWTTRNQAEVSNNTYKGQLLDGYLDVNQWSGSFSSIHRFVLPKKYILQLTGRYTLPTQKLIYDNKGFGSVGASIGKRFANDKVTLRLGSSDIFRTQRRFTTVNFGSLHYTQNDRWESRTLFVELSYKFGSTKISAPRERDAGNAEEKERVGK
jgi:outer membrane receptor protein involved in Fe transport